MAEHVEHQTLINYIKTWSIQR